MKNILLLSSVDDYYAKALQSVLPEDEYNVSIYTPVSQQLSYHIYEYVLGNKLLWHITKGSLCNSILRKLTSHVSKKEQEAVERFVPDCIIAMHPIYTQLAQACSESLGVHSCVFITDPYTIHPSWLWSKEEQYIVPYSETKDILMRILTYKADIFVTTMPVHKSFIRPEIPEVFQLYEKFNLKEAYTVFLIGKHITPHMVEHLHKKLHGKANILFFTRQKKDFSHIIKAYQGSIAQCSREDIEDGLFLSDVCLSDLSEVSFIEILVSNTIPLVYTQRYNRIRNIQPLLDKGFGKRGGYGKLIKSLMLSQEELVEHREHIAHGLQIPIHLLRIPDLQI